MSSLFSPLYELFSGRAYAPHPGDAALSLGRRFEGQIICVIGGAGTGVGWTQRGHFGAHGELGFSVPRSSSFKRGTLEWREHLALEARSTCGWAVILLEQQWQAAASAVSAASLCVSAVEQMLRVREAVADFGDDRISDDAVRVAVDHPTMEGSIVAGARASLIDTLEQEASEAGFQVAALRIATLSLFEKHIAALQKEKRSPDRSLVAFDGQTALFVGLKDGAFDQSEGGVSYLVNRSLPDVHAQLVKRISAAPFRKDPKSRVLLIGHSMTTDAVAAESTSNDFAEDDAVAACLSDSVRHDLRSNLQEMRTALPRSVRTVVWTCASFALIALIIFAVHVMSAVSTEEKITARRLEAFHYRNAIAAAEQRTGDLHRELENVHRSAEWVQRNYHAQQLIQEILNAIPNEVTLDGFHVQAVEGLSQAKLKFTLYGAEEAQRVCLREIETKLYHLGYEIGRRDDPIAASGRRGGVNYAWDVIMPSFGA